MRDDKHQSSYLRLLLVDDKTPTREIYSYMTTAINEIEELCLYHNQYSIEDSIVRINVLMEVLRYKNITTICNEARLLDGSDCYGYEKFLSPLIDLKNDLQVKSLVSKTALLSKNDTSSELAYLNKELDELVVTIKEKNAKKERVENV